MVDLQKLNSQIEEHLNNIDKASITINQRENDNSPQTSILSASDLVRFEYKKIENKFKQVNHTRLD